jgi:type 1 glutamine amidotransferase
MHDKGRVYYTSFGHRDDIWTNPQVQQIILGGFAWAMGNVDADLTPNIDAVAPKANQMKN